MSADRQPSSTVPKSRRKPEGPRNHYLTFIASILFTMLAFAAVVYGGMTRAFLVPFLVGMAIVQVILQLVYWMHMKDRGHVFPVVGIAFGGIVALSAVAAGVYWMWW